MDEKQFETALLGRYTELDLKEKVCTISALNQSVIEKLKKCELGMIPKKSDLLLLKLELQISQSLLRLAEFKLDGLLGVDEN
jgi:hypothetical protein